MAGDLAYQDFRLRIEAASTERIQRVSIVSPAGEATADIGQALDGYNLADLYRVAKSWLQGQYPADLPATEQLGSKLFKSVFREAALGCYDQSLGIIGSGSPSEERQGGLRICFQLDPLRPELLALAELPWELLYDARRATFLALDPRTVVVRYLELPSPSSRVRKPSPIRKILLAISNPRGLQSLALEEEARRIADAWKAQYGVEVTLLPNATLSGLRDAIHVENFQVFHFAGHSFRDPSSGESFLLFEKGDGEPERVSGRRLANTLDSLGELQLLFLNACDVSRPKQAGGSNLLGGLAAGLLNEGLPCVLAFHAPLENNSATIFASDFYDALARGMSLEQAVTAGRLALYDYSPETIDWAAPVLFLRSENSRLFQLPKSREPALLSVVSKPEDSSPGESRKLQTLQKDIFHLFDDIGLTVAADYSRLNKDERQSIQKDLIHRMTGLEAPPERLLELDHLNLHFRSKAFLNDPELNVTGSGAPTASLSELHRKSTVYSQHSVIQIPEVTLVRGSQALLDHSGVGEETIRLLLQNRPTIEAGKMSLVPKQVLVMGDGTRAIFSIDSLRAVEVNMQDAWTRSRFLKEGRAFEPVGVMVMKARTGACDLQGVLEIEDRYRDEYDHFQRHFRQLLDQQGGDGSHGLRLALKEVDEGIRALESRYQEWQRRQVRGLFGIMATTVTLVLYARRADVKKLLAATFTGFALSHCLEFFPELPHVPAGIRHDPFFIPWYIHREGG